MSKINIDPSKYVVLDVETNGLSSIRDDLLSISIYKPDTENMYNRFLPLELNDDVVTTHINGIKTNDLINLLPLSQDEVDDIIKTFELKHRIILTYGGIDEKFLTKYFQRHNLQGIDFFAFYNFKHDIISSRFSEGNITKDNLCKLYGIENIQKIHSGSNDCILEWKLFEKMNGNKLLITGNNVFEFNNDYIIPVSYLYTHKNFKYHLPNLPKISCEIEEVFSLAISSKDIIKFPTNFNGMIDEHLINSMLNVEKIDSKSFLLENKKKLKYLGKLPSTINIVPMFFNPDGTMTATHEQDKKLEQDINSVIKSLKELISPLIDFIKNNIFQGKIIKSQELMIYPDKKILALCDLSNENAVLEIKTTLYLDKYAEQLYYEANGRSCFILLTNWRDFPEKITYTINKVKFIFINPVDQQIVRLNKAKEKIETETIELKSYIDSHNPVVLKCKKCGLEWKTSYNTAKLHRPCPQCSESIDQKHARFENSKYKIETETIELISYIDNYNSVKLKCKNCGHIWVTPYNTAILRQPCNNCNLRWNAYKYLY